MSNQNAAYTDGVGLLPANTAVAVVSTTYQAAAVNVPASLPTPPAPPQAVIRVCFLYTPDVNATGFRVGVKDQTGNYIGDVTATHFDGTFPETLPKGTGVAGYANTELFQSFTVVDRFENALGVPQGGAKVYTLYVTEFGASSGGEINYATIEVN